MNSKRKLVALAASAAMLAGMMPMQIQAEEESIPEEEIIEEQYGEESIRETEEELPEPEQEEGMEENVFPSRNGEETPEDMEAGDETSEPDFDSVSLAQTPIRYINEEGNESYIESYTRVSELQDEIGVTMHDGWYVLDQDVTFENRLTVTGEVNLILTDGRMLGAKEGIRNSENLGASLNVFAQSNSDETMGKLISAGRNYGSGIGGNQNENNGTVRIYGGYVKATGGNEAAGIGGGQSGYGGTIEIYDGHVEAEGGTCTAGGAGIGGGEDRDGGIINIYGGTIIAKGGNGAFGAGAGIGGGDEGSGGNIHIMGGTVHAEGASWGAGIGGGNKGNGGTIVIDGGDIFAQGKKGGAGIGGGDDGNSGRIIINGGRTEAHGYRAVGVGEDGCETDFTLSDAIFLEGFEYEKRYEILSYAQDIVMIEKEAPEKESVSYIDENGTAFEAEDYTLFGDVTDVENVCMTTGWYVVKDSRTFENRPSILGDVNLILCDGVTLDMTHGFRNAENIGSSLTIWAQSSNEATMGKLICKGYSYQAGIGGNIYESNGTLVIHGGSVEARGGTDAAGIGGGESGGGGSVTILGGDIKAFGDDNGAGIGGGEDRDAGTITITGGTVTAMGGCGKYGDGAGIGGGDEASGGTITITGGTVQAWSGQLSAAIGGGYRGSSGGITISGGSVEAYSSRGKSESGAAIGSGAQGNVESIHITGGEVKASSYFNGAAIGSGTEGSAGNITIDGGIIHADSTAGACIGTGMEGKDGTVIVNGGEFHLKAGQSFSSTGKLTLDYDPCGACIGSGDGQGRIDLVEINGGVIHAECMHGHAIGGGDSGEVGKIRITGGDIHSLTRSDWGAAFGDRTGKTVVEVESNMSADGAEGEDLASFITTHTRVHMYEK